MLEMILDLGEGETFSERFRHILSELEGRLSRDFTGALVYEAPEPEVRYLSREKGDDSELQKAKELFNRLNS